MPRPNEQRQMHWTAQEVQACGYCRAFSSQLTSRQGGAIAGTLRIWCAVLASFYALGGCLASHAQSTNAPQQFNDIQSFLNAARTNQGIRGQLRGSVIYSYPNRS